MQHEIVPLQQPLTEAARQEIIDFWLAERALTPERARQRVTETIQLIRHERDGSIVGICTARIVYVQHLRSYLYDYRSMIAREHRSQGLVRHLCISSFDRLNLDFVEGRQRLPIGVILNIESSHLQAITPAVWPTTGFVFAGVRDNGNHIRVRYFDGAQIDVDIGPGRAPLF